MNFVDKLFWFVITAIIATLLVWLGSFLEVRLAVVAGIEMGTRWMFLTGVLFALIAQPIVRNRLLNKQAPQKSQA